MSIGTRWPTRSRTRWRTGGRPPASSAWPVAGVLSLLALDEAPLPGYPVVPAGLAATLALVQALDCREREAPLWVLTRGAVATAPGEAPASPVQAQAWGLGRVAGLEHPDRWGGLIDLPPVLDERAAGAAVRGAGRVLARTRSRSGARGSSAGG